uniref:DDE Tnp4 domain-containing protein n=1 Tax=Glossina palpalis gambiensis TaxID=67801 RepID=A0A1B0B171_9MUSC
MENRKLKVVDVLREREEKKNSGPVTKAKMSLSTNLVRQQSGKMAGLDLSGILNCRRRLEWTKEWLVKNQDEFLSKENLRKELLFRNNEVYHLNCFFNITERQFRYLVNVLAPVVTKMEPQRKKKFFSAEERIAITLKYLATGEVHSCRNYCFRASKSVIIKMIADICQKMHELLKDKYLSPPKSEEQWLSVADEIQRKHSISNCLGNLSMREIDFHNAIHRLGDDMANSTKPGLIMAAIVDSDLNFMYAEIEKVEGQRYDEVFEKSSIRSDIENEVIKIPKARGNKDAPYFFAGCLTLPSKPYMVKIPQPHTQSTKLEESYDAKLHNLTVMSVQAFRILGNIFPILGDALRLCEDDARKMLLGCLSLYNFLRKTDSSFRKRTEQILNSDEEDDYMLNGSEEEKRERREFTPNVLTSNCFKTLCKQRGDTTDAQIVRQQLLSQYRNQMKSST